jgi:hypothetical protein
MKDIELFFVSYGVFLIGVIILWLILIRNTKLKQRRRKELEDNFIQSLKIAFHNDTIRHCKDILDIYEGIYQTNLIKLNELLQIDLMIKKLKGFIATGIHLDKILRDRIIENINLRLAELEEHIQDKKKVLPFENVPSDERIILQDIFNISAIRKESSVAEKLNTLAELIVIRQDNLERLSSEYTVARKNAIKSYLLGLLSFVITIGFGLFLLFNFYPFKL